MWTQIVRRADLPLTPWKNGGGVTRELYVCRQQGQPLWRLSMALVQSSGPFSVYPGVARILAIVNGELELTVDGERHLLRPMQPFSFSGDAQSAGTLTAGPIEDFNVMAWPGCVPRLEILAPTGHVTAQAMVVLEGQAHLHSGGERVTLEYGDLALLDETGADLSGSGKVAAVWVTVD